MYTCLIKIETLTYTLFVNFINTIAYAFYNKKSNLIWKPGRRLYAHLVELGIHHYFPCKGA